MAEAEFLTTTRTAYDTIAADYAARFDAELAGLPLERGLLAAYAETVEGPVLDVGCGPGHVTARLHRLGLDASGIDLSPGMLAQARRVYPHLDFAEGSMTAIDRPDASLGGIVAWYSTIHVPTDELPAVFGEFRRVLVPGGYVLLAFQTGGDEHRRRTEAFGHPIVLDYYLRPPDPIADLLDAAGLHPYARLLREAAEHEAAPRAYLFARVDA